MKKDKSEKKGVKGLPKYFAVRSLSFCCWNGADQAD